LAEQFLSETSARAGRSPLTLDLDAARAIAAYRWPGNVRELRSCMERAATFCQGARVRIDDLPDKVHRSMAGQGLRVPDETEGYLTVAELERRYVLAVLESFGGNKTEAGRALGLDRRTIGRKLRSWGIPG
jgi:DNA-binding NtrC family response regulator